jgi:hypothetical protein
MPGPRIAIVGSFDPAREQELALKNVPFGKQAAEDLGRELAKQGFSLVVYSSGIYTLEVDVVRGYLSHPETEPRSIQVLYSQQMSAPVYAEEKGNETKLDYRPDLNPDWEFSFYQSLAHVDGMLILGGGPWALIAGVVAMSHRKPLLACAAFGGSGEKIWRAIRAQEYPLDEADFALMARSGWTPERAAELVALLKKQKDGFEQREKDRLEKEDKRVKERLATELQENSRINWHAITSALLFGAAVFCWPVANWIGLYTGWPLIVALFTPILAGASGATIRVVLDWATGINRTFELSTYNQYILLRYATLGIVAGGLAGLSFLLAQLFASDKAASVEKLVPFLIIIGFAAGLTAEVVLSNLRKSGAVTIELPKQPS